MVIGIDIDDTTVEMLTPMVKYADIYDTQILGRNGTNGKLGLIKDRYYLEALYDWNKKTKFDFFDTYYKNVLEECTPMPNAGKTIKKLKDEGNEIFFITARLLNIKDCDTESITKKTLEDNNIPYDKLIMNAFDKLEYCLENNIQIFIEDSYETCKQLEENGIKTYLMTTKMNQNIDTGSIERVESWDEIYNKIEKYTECRRDNK